MIVLFRVDDRLVHGQVAVGWKNALEADHLLVIDDDVYNNDFDKSLMEMSVPTGLSLSIIPCSSALSELKKDSMDETSRTIVLVKTPEVFDHIVSRGAPIDEVNIGGMRFEPGKEQVTRAVFLNDEDKRVIRHIASEGVKIEGRIVPTDKKGDFLQLI